MDQGVSLVVAEMPYATEFQLHIFAALAQEERRLISERTKAALAQAKKRGVRLGKNGELLATQRKKQFHEMVCSLRELIPHWQCASLSVIADQLNKLGVKTVQGKHFYASTTKRYFSLPND